MCMCVCLVHNHDTCCLNYSMFFCSDLPPPLQVSILAWKLIPRKWKETCWKTIPKLKSKKQLHCFTQNETIIFKNQTITIKEQRLLPFLTTSHRHHLPSSPPPFVTTSCHSFLFYVMYHPSSRSIPPLLILLLCIVMFCIVRSRTTLHQGQFHRFLFFCYVLSCYV